MNAFSFRPAPTYRAASPDEQMTAAFDMPMSLLSTLGQQAKGGILDSFGLGTAVRTVTTPETAPVESGSGIADTLGSINRAIAPENMIRRAIGKGYDGSTVLDEDKYKSSAYYRDGVKWDQGMTEDRAAALAESFDAKRVRDHFASKRPITAFIGNIAGQALDPINYIPIMGQTVKAANVARFGRVGGAAITNAIDAAANTALAGALTYSARKDFGDDITWQSTVSEIAMSALIGGAFGGVSGVLDSRRAARAANATAKASEALSTLKNVQDARVALNSAIDGLVRGEDVNLSANAVDAVNRIKNNSLPLMNEAPLDQPVSSPVGGRGGNGSQFSLPDSMEIVQADAIHKRLRLKDVTDNAGADPVDGSLGTQGITFWEDDAGVYIAGSYLPSGARGKGLGFQLYEKMAEYAQSAGKVLESDFDVSPQAVKVYDRLSAAGYNVERSVNFREGSDSGYSGKFIGGIDLEGSKTDGFTIRILPRDGLKTRDLDLSPAKPDAPPMGRAEAEARVATPENYKAASEQYGVNADDGTFIEQADVDQMRNDGRLTPDDEAALVEAETTYENGVSYGEALKAVVGCLLA